MRAELDNEFLFYLRSTSDSSLEGHGESYSSQKVHRKCLGVAKLFQNVMTREEKYYEKMFLLFVKAFSNICSNLLLLRCSI